MSSSRDGMRGDGLDTGLVQSGRPHGAAKDTNFLFVLGEGVGDLGRGHGVFGIGEHRHAREQLAIFSPAALEGDLGEPVLGDADGPAAGRMRARRSCISATVRPA
jgi:hypothetical protein